MSDQQMTGAPLIVVLASGPIADGLIAVGTGAGVGIAGVDEDGPHCAARCRVRQMFTTDLHRRGAEAVGGEDSRHRAARGQLDDAEVAPVGLLHARHGHAEANAGNGVQAGRIGGREIDGHGGLGQQ